MKRILLLLLPISAFAAAPAADWSPNGTATVAWVGNVSNGGAVWDRIGTLLLNLDAIASSRYEVGPSDAFHVTAHFAGDWYPRYKALASGAAGGRIDWHHTFGADEFAPVFSIEGAADGVYTVEHARRGTATAATLRLTKRFGAAWRAALTERFESFNARWSVFDSRSHETELEVGRDLGISTRVTLAGRWREGDVVTHAQYQRPDLAAVAHDSAVVDTFGPEMTVYAADARTLGGRVALIHATDEDTALVLAYEYARTARKAVRFENQVVSLSFVRQY